MMLNIELKTIGIGAALCAAVAFGLIGGCGNEGGPTDEGDGGGGSTAMAEDHDDHADHDHDAMGDDHDHDDEHAGHDHEEEMLGGHMHEGEEHHLGTIMVGGAELEVTMIGEAEPNAEVHIDIVQTGGERPAAVRLWIGDSTGRGSLKSKADGHDNHFHGHTEAPAEITAETELWIEVETASGDRAGRSLPLP